MILTTIFTVITMATDPTSNTVIDQRKAAMKGYSLLSIFSQLIENNMMTPTYRFIVISVIYMLLKNVNIVKDVTDVYQGLIIIVNGLIIV